MGIKINELRWGCRNIEGYFLNCPNTAGGVSVTGKFTNTGSKTIKYISLKFIPYNDVGDAVGCEIKHKSEYGLRCTGPIVPGQSQDFEGENLWYNPSIKSVKLVKAEIQYTDGTEETIYVDGGTPGLTNSISGISDTEKQKESDKATEGCGKIGCFAIIALIILVYIIWNAV